MRLLPFCYLSLLQLATLRTSGAGAGPSVACCALPKVTVNYFCPSSIPFPAGPRVLSHGRATCSSRGRKWQSGSGNGRGRGGHFVVWGEKWESNVDMVVSKRESERRGKGCSISLAREMDAWAPPSWPRGALPLRLTRRGAHFRVPVDRKVR